MTEESSLSTSTGLSVTYSATHHSPFTIEITTQARRDGDDFLIKGQKIWISGLENADWMVAITRTIPAADASPRTAGFTLFLVDVKEALAAGTLSYTPIPKMGSNIVTASRGAIGPSISRFESVLPSMNFMLNHGCP